MKRFWPTVAAIGLIAATPCAVPADASPSAAGLPVIGYAENGTPDSAVDGSASELATVGVDGINIDSSGASVPLPDEQSLALLRHAHADNLRGEILVGNYSASSGGFDSAATHALVNSESNTANVVSTLVDAVNSQGWDGVHVDLEAIRGEDRGGLVNFLTTLKAALPPGKTLSMAITAFTSAQEYVDNGYDLGSLGTVLDRVVLMAYDEHGPTWNGVGPIGGLPWQEEALKLVLDKVPAARVDLGVAGYGYTWAPDGGGQQVSDGEARQVVASDGSDAVWDATQGEWTATLHDGTVIWWSDAKSWPLRVALADKYGLHGLALWSLSLSDPITG